MGMEHIDAGAGTESESLTIQQQTTGKGSDITVATSIQLPGPDHKFRLNGGGTLSFIFTTYDDPFLDVTLLNGRDFWLYCSSSTTFNHNAASPPGGTAPLFLPGAVNTTFPAGTWVQWAYDTAIGGFSLLGFSGATATSGITQLTGEGLAGPGSGSQAFVIPKLGSVIASAGTIALPGLEQAFPVSGTTQINYVSTTGLLDGREFELLFTGTSATVGHNTASPPGGTVPILLNGLINRPFGTAAWGGRSLKLRYNATVGAVIEAGSVTPPPFLLNLQFGYGPSGGNDTIATGTTTFLHHRTVGADAGNPEIKWRVPYDLQNLDVWLVVGNFTDLGSGGSYDVTVRNNGADTAQTVNVTSTGDKHLGGAGPAAFAAGDKVSIKLVGNGTVGVTSAFSLQAWGYR